MNRARCLDWRLAVVGDSLVAGVGDPTLQGWPLRACQGLTPPRARLTLYNLGIRRETSADIRRRWKREVRARLESAPFPIEKRLVFSFGVNDMVKEKGALRVPVARSVAHARAILSEARRIAPVILIGPAPVREAAHGARIVRLSSHYEILCRELGIPYWSLVDTLSRATAWGRDIRKGDGVHPGAAGYAALAAQLRRWPVWRQFLSDGWQAPRSR